MAGEGGRPAKTRIWRCWCGAELGTIAYRRGQPTALHPSAPCLSVQAGVVSFRCPACGQVMEWRERRPTQPAA